MGDATTIQRAHQIAAVMPDMYPFGFAVHLAQAEARGEKMPWDKDDEEWKARVLREGLPSDKVGA